MRHNLHFPCRFFATNAAAITLSLVDRCFGLFRFLVAAAIHGLHLKLSFPFSVNSKTTLIIKQ